MSRAFINRYPCRRGRSAAVALLCSFFAIHVEGGWPHENSDLRPDPKVMWGVFENGVRYAVLPHSEPPERLSLRLHVAAGSLMEDEDQRGLAHFLEHMAFNGTEHFAADELVEYFQRLGMAFGADTNAYTAFDETCYKLELPRNEEALVRKGLLLLRDFACGMLLVAEEIDKERGVILSEKRARDSADYRTYVAELRHTPLGVFRDRVTNFIAGGDFRFGFPAKEVALSRTLAEVREWLRDPLSGGYLELSIVGDVELERALEAAAATFGAILTRADEKPALMEARAVRFPRDVVRKTLEYDSRLPKAMALALWPLPDMWDMARTRRLGILTDILRDRLRITLRESEGETYSPIAFSRQSLAYTDYGFLVSGAIVAPPKAEHIVETVRRLGAQLSEEGTSEDELSRALQPALTRLREQLRDNRYWLHSVLSSSQEHPQRLDWARTMQTDFKAIKKAEIDKLAATYLAPARGLAITIVPPPKKDGERRTD